MANDAPVQPKTDAPVEKTSSPEAVAQKETTSRFEHEYTNSITGNDNGETSTIAQMKAAEEESTNNVVTAGDTTSENFENLEGNPEKAAAAEAIRGQLPYEELASLSGIEPGDPNATELECKDCYGKTQDAAARDTSGVPSEVPEGEQINFEPGESGDYFKDKSYDKPPETREEKIQAGIDANKPTGEAFEETTPAGDRAPEDSIARVKDGKDGNVVRDYNEETDSESAIKERFSEMARRSHPEAADGMIQTFNDSLAKLNENLTPEQMQEVRRNLRVQMDNDNMSEGLTANTVVDHARKLEDAVDGNGKENAFMQGNNVTCALTSVARLEANQDVVAYSNKATSVIDRGGAWTGGENGQPQRWTQVDPAAFAGDAESRESYNETEKTLGGERGMAGRLDDALRGQQMADNATRRDRAEGTLGDNESYTYSSGDRNHQEGTYKRTEGTNGQPDTSEFLHKGPESSADMMAVMNHQEGLGGLLLTSSLKADPRIAKAMDTYGGHFYDNANDIREITSQNPDQEYQIGTNGAMLLGRPGHGFHSQTVRYQEGTGDLVFGNNWTAQHNNVTYSDAFVNEFTDPTKATGGNRIVDGSGPRGDGGSIRTDDSDWVKDYDKQKEEWKDQDKEDKEKSEDDNQKDDEKRNQGQTKFALEHADWAARRDAADSKGLDFNEPEPTLSQYID